YTPISLSQQHCEHRYDGMGINVLPTKCVQWGAPSGRWRRRVERVEPGRRLAYRSRRRRSERPLSVAAGWWLVRRESRDAGVGVRNDEESQTAVLVCAGRAAAHGRTPVPAFSDPTAEVLLPAEMQARVRAYRADPRPPAGARARLEHAMLRATEAVIVPRTVAIDEAVPESPAGPLGILGAGCEGRGWQLRG